MIIGWLRAGLPLAALALLLSGCGGGVGSGGTGDVASGYGMGTVTGFGSVIIDGERYEELGADFAYDTVPEAPDEPSRRFARTDLAIGQRVELEFDAGSVAPRARVFRISPALIGPVTRLSPLHVAGQPLQIVQGDPSRGPDTQFAGTLGSAQQIGLGDRLEVHGVLAPDGLRATLIKRLPPPHGKWLRLAGTVSELSADGRSFRLGELAVRLAEQGERRRGLQNGQHVQLWSRTPISDNTLVAEWIRIDRRSLVPRRKVQLSGVVAVCPDRARLEYVCVGGTPVALGGASFDAGLSPGTLEGRYVIVHARVEPEGEALGSARFSRASSR